MHPLHSFFMFGFPVLLVAIPAIAIRFSLLAYFVASLATVLACLGIWQLWPNLETIHHSPLGSTGLYTWSFPIAALCAAAVVGFMHLFRNKLASFLAWAAIAPVMVLVQSVGWVS